MFLDHKSCPLHFPETLEYIFKNLPFLGTCTCCLFITMDSAYQLMRKYIHTYAKITVKCPKRQQQHKHVRAVSYMWVIKKQKLYFENVKENQLNTQQLKLQFILQTCFLRLLLSIMLTLLMIIFADMADPHPSTSYFV